MPHGVATGFFHEIFFYRLFQSDAGLVGVFPLITLPFFRYFQKGRPRHFIAMAAARVGSSGLLLLPALSIALMEMAVNLQPKGIGDRGFGGWSVAVYLVFFMHQTVIVVIGFYLAGSTLGIPAKYLILSGTSFIIIVGLYDLTVRRIKALRFLFGMKVGSRRSAVSH